MDINLEYVSRAKQGDAQSFAMLYDQVAKDLYRVALYTLGNPQDAEDVVSETFLEAYKGLRNLRDDSKFKAWIMRILSIRANGKSPVISRQNSRSAWMISSKLRTMYRRKRQTAVTV